MSHQNQDQDQGRQPEQARIPLARRQGRLRRMSADDQLLGMHGRPSPCLPCPLLGCLLRFAARRFASLRRLPTIHAVAFSAACHSKGHPSLSPPPPLHTLPPIPPQRPTPTHAYIHPRPAPSSHSKPPSGLGPPRPADQRGAGGISHRTRRVVLGGHHRCLSCRAAGRLPTRA